MNKPSKNIWYMKNRDREMARMKKWRLANMDKFHAICKRSRDKKQDFINRAKCKPCMDCGILYPSWVMQFDHRDPSEKSIGIARCKYMSIDRLKQEIIKCDVVCANCHAQRTHNQIVNKIIYTGPRLKILVK